MPEVMQEAKQEFWRPPVPVSETSPVVVREDLPVMAEACPSCSTEFMIGARFCHACGATRPERNPSRAARSAGSMSGFWTPKLDWMQSAAATSWRRITAPDWLHYLHFHEIKRVVGLPTASLIALLAGLGCVVAALSVGLMMTPKTLVEWQAVQFYRAEWLLGATAAFVAGILLKKPTGN